MFRPQGLLTLSTVSFLTSPSRPYFMPAALMGRLPFGAFSAEQLAARFRACRTHVPFSPSGHAMPLSQQGRPRKAAVPRFIVRSSVLWSRNRTFSPSQAGCSLGLFPLKALKRVFCARFRPRLLPRAFRRVAPENDANRRHLGVSINTRPATTHLPNKSAWL